MEGAMLTKIIDEDTKECLIVNQEEAKEMPDMEELDVECSYDGRLYLKGFAPEEPAPTMDEQKERRAKAYQAEVDPITAHIQRERDEETPDEDKIAALKAERAEKVAEIKERYPYPEGGEDGKD